MKFARRIRIRVGQRELEPDVLIIRGGATLTQQGPNAVLDLPAGGGGGSSDHAALTHLSWGSSGHTGTASRFAIFGSGGAADYLAYPSTGLVAWSGTTWASVTIDTPLGLSGGHLSVDLSAYLTTASAASTYLSIAGAASAYQPLDTDLTAIAALGASGLIVKTGAGSAAARMITSSNGIATTNGDGVAGNPLVTLATCTVNTDVDATSYHWWRIQTEGTLVVGSGVTGFSAPSGTVTLAAVASGYIGIAATITNNLSFYTVRSNSALYQTGFGGTNGSTTKLHYVSPTSTASHRVWFALSTNLGTGSNPAANSCGIVYDPARSANWLVFSYDGTMQTSDTGVVYSVSTHYYLKLRTTSTGVYGVVSTTASGLNGAETSVTSHLISSTASQYILFLAVRTAAGALSPVTFCGMDYTASYQ